MPLNKHTKHPFFSSSCLFHPPYPLKTPPPFSRGDGTTFERKGEGGGEGEDAYPANCNQPLLLSSSPLFLALSQKKKEKKKKRSFVGPAASSLPKNGGGGRRGRGGANRRKPYKKREELRKQETHKDVWDGGGMGGSERGLLSPSLFYFFAHFNPHECPMCLHLRRRRRRWEILPPLLATPEAREERETIHLSDEGEEGGQRGGLEGRGRRGKELQFPPFLNSAPEEPQPFLDRSFVFLVTPFFPSFLFSPPVSTMQSGGTEPRRRRKKNCQGSKRGEVHFYFAEACTFKHCCGTFPYPLSLLKSSGLSMGQGTCTDKLSSLLLTASLFLEGGCVWRGQRERKNA